MPCRTAHSLPVHPAAIGSAASTVSRSAAPQSAAAVRATSAVLSLLWSSTTTMCNDPA